LLAHGRWFSPGTPASSTTKTGCHDIAEILLKVVLNKINQNQIKSLPDTKHHLLNRPPPQGFPMGISCSLLCFVTHLLHYRDVHSTKKS